MKITPDSLLPHFHTLYLEGTRRCNLSCQYCSTGSNGRYTTKDKLSAQIILERILIPARDIGTKSAIFSGGEFLLRRDAFQILQEAHRLGFRISIVSNGTTLTRSLISRLKNTLNDNLQVSLGINSFDLENGRTREQGVDKTLNKIQLLQELEVKVNLSVAIGQYNKNSFRHTSSRIKDLGLSYNRIPFVVRNCSAPELMLDKRAMMKYFHPTLRNCFNGGVSYTPFLLDEGYYTKISGQDEQNHRVPTNPSIGCWCGSFYAVNPEGDVSICPLLLDHVSGGNIFTTDLADIIFHSPLFKRILDRDSLEGKCGTCKYRFTCGGCRAMAYYQNDQLFGEDPTCFVHELTTEEIQSAEEETRSSFNNYLRMTQFAGTSTTPGEELSAPE